SPRSITVHTTSGTPAGRRSGAGTVRIRVMSALRLGSPGSSNGARPVSVVSMVDESDQRSLASDAGTPDSTSGAACMTLLVITPEAVEDVPASTPVTLKSVSCGSPYAE